MNTKRIFLILLVFQSYWAAIGAQNLFTTAEMAKANTAANATYLSDDEKQVVLYMNLARLDGERFFKSFIPGYILENNAVYTPKISSNNKYLTSLKTDLYKVKNLQMMVPHKPLSLAAQYHAKDMGRKGSTGHDSSDGTACFKRIERFFPKMGCAAENCSYGEMSPLSVVCQLLLDDCVPSLGHRINILNPSMAMVGVGIAPHKTYKSNCVTDFSCDAPEADRNEINSDLHPNQSD